MKSIERPFVLQEGNVITYRNQDHTLITQVGNNDESDPYPVFRQDIFGTQSSINVPYIGCF